MRMRARSCRRMHKREKRRGHDRFLYADGANAGEVAHFWYTNLRNGQRAKSRKVGLASVRPPA